MVSAVLNTKNTQTSFVHNVHERTIPNNSQSGNLIFMGFEPRYTSFTLKYLN